VLVNPEAADALSTLCPRSVSHHPGQAPASKRKDLIPRELDNDAIPAAIGSKVIGRTTVKAIRKDVAARCHGGDIGRERKLLEKQKEGRKRMRAVGSADVPQADVLARLRPEE
jgi:GTP-binding protein LepA